MVINVLVAGPRHGEMVSSNLLQCYILVQEMFCVLFLDYEMSPITRWGRKIGNCVWMAHESGLMRLFDGVGFFFFLVFYFPGAPHHRCCCARLGPCFGAWLAAPREQMSLRRSGQNCFKLGCPKLVL